MAGWQQKLWSPWCRALCLIASAAMSMWLFVGAEVSNQPPWIAEPFDKLVHFGYFAAIAGLLAHGLGYSRLWLAVLLVAVLGGLDEWHQMSVPGRYASLLDWLADLVGGLFACYVYLLWARHAGVVRIDTHD